MEYPYKFYNLTEVSQILGKSLKTVKDYIESKLLPAYAPEFDLPGRYLVDVSDLAAFIKTFSIDENTIAKNVKKLFIDNSINGTRTSDKSNVHNLFVSVNSAAEMLRIRPEKFKKNVIDKNTIPVYRMDNEVSDKLYINDLINYMRLTRVGSVERPELVIPKMHSERQIYWVLSYINNQIDWDEMGNDELKRHLEELINNIQNKLDISDLVTSVYIEGKNAFYAMNVKKAAFEILKRKYPQYVTPTEIAQIYFNCETINQKQQKRFADYLIQLCGMRDHFKATKKRDEDGGHYIYRYNARRFGNG